MMADKVMGLSPTEIAEKYRLAPGEVRKGLIEAEREGVLELIEAGIFRDIMPKALAVLEYHLDEKQSLKAVELAMALFGAVKTSVKAKNSFEVNVAPGQNIGIMSLEAIRQEKVIESAAIRQRYDGRAESHDPDRKDPNGDVSGIDLERQHQHPPG